MRQDIGFESIQEIDFLEALLPRLRQHEDGSFLATHVERHRKDVASAKAETVSGPDAAISGTEREPV